MLKIQIGKVLIFGKLVKFNAAKYDEILKYNFYWIFFVTKNPGND